MARSFIRRLLVNLNCLGQWRLQSTRKASDRSSSSENTEEVLPSSEPALLSNQSGSIVESWDDSTEDQSFWWKNTYQTLRTLLTQAGYSASDQDAILDFHRRYIIGSLGPRPSASGGPAQWRSFMTDDFSPMEWSWNWGLASKRSKPTVRYSIEAISRDAGTHKDPWNMNPTLKLIQQFEENLPGFDSSMFWQLFPRLTGSLDERTSTRDRQQPPTRGSPSSLFLAFDLNGPIPTVKVYAVNFMDIAGDTGQRKGQIIRNLLMPMAQASEWMSLISLLEFGMTSDTTFGIEPFIVAWDCVALEENRIKVYFRSASTSFLSMVKVLCAHDPLMFEGNTVLQDLQALWKTLFGQDPRKCPNEALRHKEHSTAGLLFYFDVRPGSDNISSKVYLPVRHYGIDDSHTTEALRSFFDERRPGPQRTWTGEYASAVRSICGHRKLEDGLGLHTYVSCAVKNGSLDVTSYFNPEIYHASRTA